MRTCSATGNFLSVLATMRRCRRFPFALFATALMVSVAGCSSPLPDTELPPTRFIAPAREFPGLSDYRGIVDFKLKQTGLEQSAVADPARTAQIDFIFLADQVKPGDGDFGIAGFTSQILFIAGGAFQVDGGEIIGVNIHQPIKPNLTPNDLITSIHDQGGLAIAADIAKFSSVADYALADGVEVYNQRSAWQAQSRRSLYLHAIFWSPDLFLSSLEPRPDSNLAEYDKIAAGARVTMLAGFGAPDNLSIIGSKVGTLEQLFLFYTTHLLAHERDTGPLLEALKRGHSYVSFDYLGYVGDFAFFGYNSNATGWTKTMMGDEIALKPGLVLKAELPGAAERIVMYQDGAQVASAGNAAVLEFAPKSPGAYRIEAYRKGVMWILSNPVYVR